MTLQVNVGKDYLLKKDLDVTNIKKALSAVMGRSFLMGTDGMLNEHVYPPNIRQLKFVSGRNGQIDQGYGSLISLDIPGFMLPYPWIDEWASAGKILP